MTFRPAPKPARAREKKCPICKFPFIKRSSTQRTCSWQCALKQVEKDKERQARIEKRKGLEKLKTLSDHLKEAQAEFNGYIRDRDSNLPCISCRRFHNGKYEAGHYRSVGAAPHLRFDEDNVHKQCSPCNNHKSGNQIEYRINLIERIGVIRVEALEQNNTPRKYTIEEVKAIRQHYKEKRKALLALRS